MNIISGIARGIILNVPKGLAIRPTAVKAKKSFFDSYGNWQQKTVVDLFAGTGAIGLEAASRGSDSIYFVESNFKHCKIIESNIKKVEKAGVNSEFYILCENAVGIHKTLPLLSGKVDIIFADPPYDIAADIVKEMLHSKEFAEWAGHATFIFEAPSESSRKPLFNNMDLWNIKKSRKLGQSLFYFLNVKQSD